jgi:hypothetical protein
MNTERNFRFASEKEAQYLNGMGGRFALVGVRFGYLSYQEVGRNEIVL